MAVSLSTKSPVLIYKKSVYFINFSVVYMATYNTIDTLVFMRADDAHFIIGDKLNHIFYFELT
jgi:hypothetical protein